ncbi:Gfo/Idh/MocA family oxidoreductase [Microbacterium sp. NEAU-LLC]|uniref:Gfo/Idh/MocA family oxidoreductase n=1 Tax=Microbacterium helvum TaxID=2773713 RepID=A0ABR8NTQ2_9MICO|nr:Gfo/Idh/MocA family oxidoreductase [Microbacterium helvum]MBD3943544.1 Gfo/Idh/MocA family oxidoreductase [Microbacterium helvum]
MTFALLPDDVERVRVVVVGAGPMGRAWLHTIVADDAIELAGIADLAVHVAEDAAREIGLAGLPTGTDGVELARRTGAHAIVDVTVPAAHHPVTLAALRAGLPVLGEKPAAATVAEALSLAAAATLTGRLFMVSQSRRYNDHLYAARAAARRLGRAGILSVDFFKAPRFGGFRDEMASPLLLDMAIHQFDMARFLLDADPVSVLCDEYNPAWSWYAGDAAATAAFAFEGGARFVFAGSWCSPGAETSWNGAWRLSAEGGTVLWDGDDAPIVDAVSDGADRPVGEAAVTAAAGSGAPVSPAPGDGIAGSLREFTAALRTGVEPMGRVHENILSLAMVEAAMLSAREGRRVTIDEILEASLAAALDAERDLEVRDVMAGWGSVRDALSSRTG